MKRFLRLCRAYVRAYVFRTCPSCKLRDRGCMVCDDYAHRYAGVRPNRQTLSLWIAFYRVYCHARITFDLSRRS